MASSRSHARRPANTEAQLDAVFHALGHRSRRALLARLARSPAMITELAAPFAMSLPAVSRHIRVLEEAGLVTRSVQGRVHRCSLDPRQLASARKWLDHYRAFWDQSLEALARYAEKR